MIDEPERKRDTPESGAEALTLDVKRGLFAIIYGDNGATAREVDAARSWLKSQGIEPTG